MSKSHTLLALSFVLPSLAFATAAAATPVASSVIVGMTEPAFSTARATLGRRKVLPEKKRIHNRRKSAY